MPMMRHHAMALYALALVSSAGIAEANETDDTALRRAVEAQRARPPVASIDRERFVSRATVSDVTLSPDGKYVAYVHQQGDRRAIELLPTGGGAARRIVGQSDASRITWTTDSHWILLQSSGQLFAVAVAPPDRSGKVSDLAGGMHRQWLHVDPSQTAAVIVRERTTGQAAATRWRTVRIDVHGKRTVLDENARKPVDVTMHASGGLAFIQRAEDDALVTYRVAADGHQHAIFRCTQLHRCTLWPLTMNDGSLLMLGDLDSDLSTLARLLPDGHWSRMQADPQGEADIDELVADPSTGLPAVIGYRSTVAANVGVEQATQMLMDRFAQRYPGRNLAVQPGGAQQATWLITENDATVQGTRYHLFDAATGTYRDILDHLPVSLRSGLPTPWIETSQLANKLSLSWRATDGMRLHGFLWLPPGRDPAKLPLITMVHGGPWNHVGPGYFGTGYAQLLANRGYVVFEPNFRGSTGYGRHYMFAAQGDFGNGRVQRDIIDGTRYLLGQGIGDADRVGIVGASFGGYATLLGVTYNPELFKVGVAVVPPTDFAWDLTWLQRSAESRVLSGRLPFEQWLRILSLDTGNPSSMARLHAQSPLNHAASLHRPLLIVAGGEDRRVAVRGVLGYAAQLKLLGKDISLLVDDDAGHVNEQAVATEASFYLMLQMLGRVLGGPRDGPPDAAIKSYLSRHMVLAGGESAAGASIGDQKR